MKLSAIAVNSAVIEQGDWVENIPDLPGIRIKARGTGNADYRLLEGKLLREIPRGQRVSGLSVADQDRITVKLLVETVVLDIDGMTEDDDVTPIKYTKDLGAKWLSDPDYRVLLQAAAFAGASVAERRKADEVLDAKN
jgi:hypothetical protein